MGKVNNFYKSNQYITICPKCRRVKKHRTWLEITDLSKQMQILVALYLKEKKTMEVLCPKCE